jgi:acyl-CoA synthetase (AMP-forming)/AMP-acid ligase II
MRAAEGIPLTTARPRTLNALFQETVAAHADLPALGVATSSDRISYREFERQVAAYAHLLERRGVQSDQRIVLLSAPQAFFGLALNGLILGLIIVILMVTAWITVVQRMHFVYRQTSSRGGAQPIPLTTEKTFWLRRRRRTGTRP